MKKKQVDLRFGVCDICGEEDELIFTKNIGTCYDCQKYLDRVDETNLSSVIDKRFYDTLENGYHLQHH